MSAAVETVRVRRRIWRKVLTAGVATAVVAGGVTLAGRLGDGREASSNTPTVQTTTADVRRTSLVNRERVDGTLGYADSGRTLSSQHEGILTALAAEGDVVGRGARLYRVGDKPVILLFGSEPMWRQLAAGTTGADVRQLKDNLIALGYAKGLTLGSDSKFNDATTTAVKRFQKAIGVEQTGVLALGDIVFLPDAVRIGPHKATIGSTVQPGGEITEYSSTQRVVKIDLDASKQSLVKVGDQVDVRLPSGKTAKGKVTNIAKVAKGPSADGDDDTTTIGVTVVLDDPAAAGDLDQAPVKVSITTARADNVLAVPVSSLLAIGGGQYGVEVERDGVRRVVAVETGLFSDADNLVEIRSGDLKEGDKVVVPV